MHKAIYICITSLFLGAASPFMANVVGVGATSEGLLHAWLLLFPSIVDQWLWPEGAVAMLALAVLVLTLQYFVLFALITALLPLEKLVLDFMG